MSAVERQELASAKKIPSLEVVEQKVYISDPDKIFCKYIQRK